MGESATDGESFRVGMGRKMPMSQDGVGFVRLFRAKIIALGSTTTGAKRMRVVGLVLLVISLCVAGYGLSYQTFVYAPSGDAVNNYGLMHNQSLILGGAGVAFLGSLIMFGFAQLEEAKTGAQVQTPFTLAVSCIKANDTAGFLAALRRPDLHLDSTDDGGMTLLHHAAARQNYEAVKALIERHARKDLADYKEKLAIEYADETLDGIKIRELLK
ncbi:ankyrin repeat domain-containing protein [Chromobacterium violaceum]|uniref:ankyrin repeat domain-containing protein n=1 Tax=Chromobacterium violaceum TaxID=536 RepID=UPI001C8CC1EE|nr:ankyrin repeat domain-containing protein [Chromobacterium violaceum]